MSETPARATLKARLAAGEPLLGTFLKTPSPMVCEVLGRAALDLVCIDAEHAPFDRGDIDACVMALRSVGMASVVRVPASRAEYVLNALDCGADGVLAPHIASAGSAEELVRWAQYGPQPEQGEHRGYAGSTRAAAYMGRSMADQLVHARAHTVVIAQIEDAAALKSLDALFAVEGVDAFFIGRADLSVSLGAQSPNDPRVVAAVERICRAGAQAGRVIGLFTGDVSEVAHWRGLGASLFLLSSDHAMMLQGAAALSEAVRAQF